MALVCLQTGIEPEHGKPVGPRNLAELKTPESSALRDASLLRPCALISTVGTRHCHKSLLSQPLTDVAGILKLFNQQHLHVTFRHRLKSVFCQASGRSTELQLGCSVGCTECSGCRRSSSRCKLHKRHWFLLPPFIENRWGVTRRWNPVVDLRDLQCCWLNSWPKRVTIT